VILTEEELQEELTDAADDSRERRFSIYGKSPSSRSACDLSRKEQTEVYSTYLLFGTAQKVLKWIDWIVVDADLVMEMRTG
jgi:hypothetical protein